MPAELVRVETSDGLRLDGALQVPVQASKLPLDAFLLIHGTGGNFHASGVLETFGGLAIDAGCAVLRINTRGHDGMVSIPTAGRSVRGGATYETIADCRQDLGAWIALLNEYGYGRIVLVGHSMGGVKALYAQAHDRHLSVVAIVGISPPRFCHDRLTDGPQGAAFRQEFARMRALVERGEQDALVPVTQPLHFVATPAGYLEKYGPEDRYDFIRYLSQIDCPVLILVGSESASQSTAFHGVPETLDVLRPSCPQLECQVVIGANINYANDPRVPFERTAEWLMGFRRRISAPSGTSL